VAERLRRLTDGGALSIHAEVEPRALGYAICAIVRSAQPRATSS
jgi:DNA-binding Lrp family transcriptional regulator